MQLALFKLTLMASSS